MPPDSAEQLARMAAELRGVDLEPQADKGPGEGPQAEEEQHVEQTPQPQLEAEWRRGSSARRRHTSSGELDPRRAGRMTILRACVNCGRPSPEGHCAEHKPKPWATSKRRERMGMSGGAWETVRRRVLDRDQGVCYLCDQLGADEVDHLIDVAAGGTSRMDNLASCHPDCHRRKHGEPEWAGERVQMALGALSR